MSMEAEQTSPKFSREAMERSRQLTVSICDELDRSVVRCCKVISLFDVEQTADKELPQFAKTTGDPKGFADKLKALAAKQGFRSNMTNRLPQSKGFPTEGKSG
jgi:hypothetical protein